MFWVITFMLGTSFKYLGTIFKLGTKNFNGWRLMPPTLGLFCWHVLSQCQIVPVGYRKSAAMSSLVQKWWCKERVFLMWWWIHCGTVLRTFGVILVPFLGHLRSWGSVLGSPGLSWDHFGIHIRFCHHFWPNPSKNPSPFWDPFWDYYAYVDVFRAFFMMSDFVMHFWRDIGGCNVDEVL